MSAATPLSSSEEPAQNPTDARRVQILDAARVCFGRWGFHGASMHQICREAGMSPGALYRYFPSKESIIAAIAAEEREQATHVMAAFATDASIVDRIVAVCMAYLRDVKRRGHGALMVEICVESIRNSALGQQFHAIECGVRNAFQQALQQAHERGEIDATVDVEMALHVLFSMGDGLVLRMQLEPDFDLARLEPSIRRTVEGLLLPRPKSG